MRKAAGVSLRPSHAHIHAHTTMSFPTHTYTQPEHTPTYTGDRKRMTLIFHTELNSEPSSPCSYFTYKAAHGG